MKDIIKELARAALWFVVIILVGNILLSKCETFYKDTPPVEEIRIDSIQRVNDTIKIQVNQIDSIKNAEIIKVKELDNDSTLELFYKLIRE